MQIADLLANPKLVIEQARSEIFSQLRPGQTVQAAVLEPPRMGIARLRIGNSEVMIRTLLPLVTGEQLQLYVQKDSNSNQLELRLIQEATLKHYQAQALRTLLPRQIPLQKLMESIRQIVGNNPGRSSPDSMEIKPPVTATISETRAAPAHRQLLQTLRVLAPETLRNALPSEAKAATQGEKTVDMGKQPATTERRLTNVTPLEKQPPTTGRRLTGITPPLQRLVGNPQAATLPTTGLRGTVAGLPPAPATTLPVPATPPLAHTAGSETRTSAASSAVAEKAIGTSGIPSGRSAPPQVRLSAELVQRIEAVLNHGISENTPLSATKIREAFSTSGLFLEAGLTGGAVPTIDLKASLLHLLLHLRPSIGRDQRSGQGKGGQSENSPTQTAGLRILAELQSMAEGALARIQVNQFTALPQDEGTRQVWQFELPFVLRDSTDSFLIRIEREDDRSDDKGAFGWTVTLNFDIDPIGPMSAKLWLQDDEISSHFVARIKESAILVEEALPHLAEAYLRAGLKVGKLSCRQGRPDDLNTQTPPIDLPLLDEKA